MISVPVFTYEYGEKRTFVVGLMYVERVCMSLFFIAVRIALAVSRAQSSDGRTQVFSVVHEFPVVCVSEQACVLAQLELVVVLVLL